MFRVLAASVDQSAFNHNSFWWVRECHPTAFAELSVAQAISASVRKLKATLRALTVAPSRLIAPRT
jgi:hypothetical protein